MTQYMEVQRIYLGEEEEENTHFSSSLNGCFNLCRFMDLRRVLVRSLGMG